MLARLAAAARDAADLAAVRVGAVEPVEEALGVERERIGQEDEMRRVAGSTPSSARQRAASAAGIGQRFGIEMNGVTRDARQHAGGEREARPLLDLVAAADHAAGRAAEQQSGAQLGRDQRGHAVELGRVVRRDEGDDQVRHGTVELGAHGGRGPRDRVFE